MRLIDVLNKIANGELKEGTKVKVGEQTFTLEIDNDVYGTDLVDLDDECNESIMQYSGLGRLNDEVELIEPQEPTECNHIWDNRPVLAFSKEKGEFINIKKCMKCGKWEEPTDNTKIEELDIRNVGNYTIWDVAEKIQYKLNEVIRKINKENNNE